MNYRFHTCLHAFCQCADMSDLLRVDDLVDVDERQVGFGRHERLATETLKVLATFLCNQVLEGERSYDESDKIC